MQLLVELALFSLSSVALSQTKYERIVKELRNLHSQYPLNTEIVSLGANDQGTEILGIKIESAFTISAADKVNNLVVGTHHVNEVDTAPLSVAFAKKLLIPLSNPLSRGFSFLSDVVYYDFPVLNVTGFNIRKRQEKDSRGVWRDPNRDYPDACIKKENFKLRSVRNLAKFVEEKDVVAAVTIHGYVGTLTFPWGFFPLMDFFPLRIFFLGRLFSSWKIHVKIYISLCFPWKPNYFFLGKLFLS